MNEEDEKRQDEPSVIDKLLYDAVNLISEHYRPAASYSDAEIRMSTEELINIICRHLLIAPEMVANTELIELLKDNHFVYSLVPGQIDFIWIFNHK